MRIIIFLIVFSFTLSVLSRDAFYESALKMKERIHGEKSSEVISYLVKLGDECLRKGLYCQARKFYEDARSRLSNSDQLSCARIDYRTGLCYQASGDRWTAEKLFLKVLSIQQELLGFYHLETSKTLYNLAVMYEQLSMKKKAELIYMNKRILTRGLSLAVQYDKDEVHSRAADLYSHASLYADALKSALPAYREAAARYGTDHVKTAEKMVICAEIYWWLSMHEQAEMMYEKAREIFIRNHGHYHFQTLETTHSLAALLVEMGKLIHAEELYEHVYWYYKRTFGMDHFLVKTMKKQIERLYENEGHEHKKKGMSQKANDGGWP